MKDETSYEEQLKNEIANAYRISENYKLLRERQEISIATKKNRIINLKEDLKKLEQELEQLEQELETSEDRFFEERKKYALQKEISLEELESTYQKVRNWKYDFIANQVGTRY